MTRLEVRFDVPGIPRPQGSVPVEKREQRFCLCGWSVYGADLERRNAFTLHWASRNHKRAMKLRQEPVGVESQLSKESE